MSERGPFGAKRTFSEPSLHVLGARPERLFTAPYVLSIGILSQEQLIIIQTQAISRTPSVVADQAAVVLRAAT